MNDPSAGEWVAAVVATVLVVVLGAVHLVRPLLPRSPATPWGRVAGFLLAVLATGIVLCVAIGVTAWGVATHEPAGPFAGVLVHRDPRLAALTAGYLALLALPFAAAVGVVGLAVIDVGRPSAFRAVAAGACGVVMAVGGVVVMGDAGPAVTGAAWAGFVCAAAAAGALVTDELRGRQPSPSSASDSSTSSSQRSLQSLQR